MNFNLEFTNKIVESLTPENNKNICGLDFNMPCHCVQTRATSIVDLSTEIEKKRASSGPYLSVL